MDISNLNNIKNDIEKGNYIALVINQEALYMKDYGCIGKVIGVLEYFGTKARNSLFLQFKIELKEKDVDFITNLNTGEDNSHLTLYSNKDIREYVKGLYDKHRHIFYFLSGGTTTFLFSLCLADNIKYTIPIEERNEGDRHAITDFKIAEKLKEDIIEQTKMYGFLVGDTEENIKSVIDGIYFN